MQKGEGTGKFVINRVVVQGLGAAAKTLAIQIPLNEEESLSTWAFRVFTPTTHANRFFQTSNAVSLACGQASAPRIWSSRHRRCAAGYRHADSPTHHKIPLPSNS